MTSPAHVQQVLRDNAANYVRDGKGMLWRSVRRLFGEGILTEGQVWQASRKTMQPLFTAKRRGRRARRRDGRGDHPAVDDSPTERTVDIGAELSRIVCRAIMRILFADKMSVPDALRIVSAQNTIATAILVRLLVPFVPNAIPMPGDRAFRAAVQTDRRHSAARGTRAARRQPDDSDDIISTLSRARGADGGELDERQVRNDTVAMFATTTETTYGGAHLAVDDPRGASRGGRPAVCEIDRVVGSGPVRRAAAGPADLHQDGAGRVAPALPGGLAHPADRRRPRT